ncbi:unnamed protein product [Rotaria sordida]|uniref:BED-type domain-containing protein n=1 Tax=Rotaria sordida TaxID=392033 RepID=A0A815MQY4_9BILA|nr:unnamed protein product [Rotaria sordida]CAF4021428.1 unnamed protein product [Rotaria sordida]
MVKVVKRNKKIGDHIVNESSLIDCDELMMSSSTSNTNEGGNTVDVVEVDDDEKQGVIRESSVWKYATKIDPEKARCDICKIEISRKGQSTSGVRRHLRTVHKLKEFEEKTIKTTKKNIMINNLSPDKKQKLHVLALNAIVEDGRSFNDLNKPGIIKLFNGFRPPHRNTVKRNLKRLNQQHVKKMSTQLHDANFIAITTDFWSDRSSRSYICITGHWFTNNIDIKSKILVFAPFQDRHTADNVSSEIEQHLKRLNIFDKTVSVTCDGASNIKAAFKKLDPKIRRIQCLAHKLHLIISNALGLWLKPQKQNGDDESNGSDEDEYLLDNELKSLSLNELNNHENTTIQDEEVNDKSSGEDENVDSSEETEEERYWSSDLWSRDVITDLDLANDLQQHISIVLNKCRSLIKMVNKSTNLSRYIDKLKDISKIRRSLSIDCKSRWNSTKLMLENMLKLKSLIIQLHSDKHDLSLTTERKIKLASLELTSDEWRTISSLKKALVPFHEATKLISGQKYCTIGTAFFAIRKIKNFLETNVDNDLFVNEIQNNLLDQLVKYIDNDKEQFDLIIVCLDDDFNAIIHDRDIESNSTQASFSLSSSSSQNNRLPKKSIFSSFLDSVATNTTTRHVVNTSSNNSYSIADEFLIYKSLATKEVQKIVREELNPDPIKFWQI